MVAIITLCFAACWLLTHVLGLLRHFGPRIDYGTHADDVIYLLKIIAHTLTFSTPVINPFLYGFYNENFHVPLLEIRKNIKKIICFSRTTTV